MKRSIKEGFIASIPVMAGYLVLGAAFGAYVYQYKLPLYAAILMSVIIYAGSMQFAAVPLLVQPFAPIQTLLLTLSINARHLFYGISMNQQFKSAGKKKHYMIFALTDESYSVIIDQKDNNIIFWTMLLNQVYWVCGTLVGYLLIQFIPINTNGIEFSMTALFAVIFIEKCLDKKPIPIVIGLVASIGCLIVFGANSFIIPSMILIMGLLLWGGNKK